MIRLALLLAFAFAPLKTADAVFVDFRLDDPNGTVSGNTYSFTSVGVMDNGVTFDATVNVTGSANLTQLTTGLGVAGGMNDLLNSGEFLQFSVMVSNVVGGTVFFNGFPSIDFNNFEPLNDTSFLSTSADPADEFDTVATDPFESDAAPTEFFLIGNAGGDFPPTSFRVDSIIGDFTGEVQAAPEPSSLALLLLAMGGGAYSYRRRRENEADSDVPHIAEN